MKKALLLGSIAFVSVFWGLPTPRPPASQSAGVIERELQREYEAKVLEPDKEIPVLEIDIPEERLQMPKGTKVSIQEIAIEGNESFSCKEILKWVIDWTCGEWSLEDIYKICKIIDQNYAKRGYFLARAYPPPQKIEGGLLTIRIIEGRLGDVEVEGNNRYSTAFIQKYFTRLQKRPVRYEEFMRALLLLNENSDLSAGAVFQKGKEVGTTDLLIRVDDGRPIHLYLNANNYGRKLTTNFRAGGRLDWGNLLKYGDTLSIAEVVGFPVDALYFTDVRYKIPVTWNGAFVELAYLYSIFDVEVFRSFHLKGKSIIYTAKGSYALTRSRNLSVDFFSYFDYKQIQNFALGTLTSYDKLRVVTAGFLIDHYNPRQGRDYLNVRVGCGIPHFLGGLKVVAPHSSRPPAGGRFIVFNADYDRLQHLVKEGYLYIHASGQYSPSKLTVPEQIYIGGADTVRGYPLAVALGDSGYYGNVELRIPPLLLSNVRFLRCQKWKDVLQIVGFFDFGGTFLQSFDPVYLCGSGLGFRFKGPWNLSLSLDVGFPLNRRDLSTGAFTYIKVTGQPF